MNNSTNLLTYLSFNWFNLNVLPCCNCVLYRDLEELERLLILMICYLNRIREMKCQIVSHDGVHAYSYIEHNLSIIDNIILKHCSKE